jgi:hypothetical protein
MPASLASPAYVHALHRSHHSASNPVLIEAFSTRLSDHREKRLHNWQKREEQRQSNCLNGSSVARNGARGSSLTYGSQPALDVTGACNMTSIRLFLIGALATLMFVVSAQAAAEGLADDRDRLFQERTYQGKPLTFWLKVIRDRDEDQLSAAFDAIHSLGSDAWVAVPELARLVDAAFAAIDIDRDSEAVVAAKVYDISVRSEAIDTLGWIGESAAPSTMALLHWGLTKRVTPPAKHSTDKDELFIELVAMDAEQRMRVAGAIAQFGQDTFPAIAKMLASTDSSKRKLAVAVLSQDALPVATELLRSKTCDDRELGLQILKDMDLVVSPAYIDELSRQIRENCTLVTEVQ